MQTTNTAENATNLPLPTVTTRRRVSRQAKQFLTAQAMPSFELGAVIKVPTDNITKQIGSALAHEAEAKKARTEARNEFAANIAYYYEVKRRLLNPGYRADLDGGNDRTPEDNQKYFGAADWAGFVAKWVGYSLQHADRKLKEFAKKNGLLADSDDSTDDAEPDGDVPARPQPRRENDPTPQKRYEFIATAAMNIANRNPEGDVEKQILAAAEHAPAPLMPVPPDVFTEVLSFMTKISSSVTDDDVRSEAKRLIGKMLLHRPVPDATKILSEAEEEEARKRNKRLAQKNGQALGSENYNPPPSTSEHVQRFDAEARGDSSRVHDSAPAIEPDTTDVLVTAASAGDAPTESSADAVAEVRKPVASVKVTKCPPAYESESEGTCERVLPDATDYIPAAVMKLGYALNEDGKLEYVGNPDAVA